MNNLSRSQFEGLLWLKRSKFRAKTDALGTRRTPKGAEFKHARKRIERASILPKEIKQGLWRSNCCPIERGPKSWFRT